MSQTNTTEDAGVPTRTADRLRAGIGVLKRGLIETWLVAFAVVSVVGYGVRDGFQRRPAVGVIYTATVALGLFGAVVGVGRLFDVSLIGPVGVGVAGGIVVGSTACSLVLDDTADRDYRHQVASRLPVDTGGSTNARASAGASPTAAETEEPAEPPADGDEPGSPRDESNSDGQTGGKTTGVTMTDERTAAVARIVRTPARTTSAAPTVHRGPMGCPASTSRNRRISTSTTWPASTTSSGNSTSA
jgi:hypothetical protein